jgi:putative redox protein
MASIILRQVEKHMMVGTDSHGHSIVIGRSPDPMHEWAGVKPSDLLLMAAASCSAYDVVDILNKQREPYHDLQVVCTGDQLMDPPYTFTRIHLHYQVHGKLRPEKVERAIQLSMEKYCSVINTIRPDTAVTHDFEILP